MEGWLLSLAGIAAFVLVLGAVLGLGACARRMEKRREDD